MALSKVNPNFVNVSQVGGRRNLIINGAMQVAQRGTSGSIASGVVNPNYASVDRFKTEAYEADQFVGTWAQVTDAPAGFSYSAKWTTTTAETAIDSPELFDVRHIIEAQDVAHLEYGSSDAKTCTLSFWVKSSVTGTFTVNVYNMDSSRQLPIEYTITAANTWEKKILTVIGDTGGSNFANDNGAGLQFTWNLAAGSDYSGTAVTGSWAAYSGPAWAGANQSNAVGTTLNATWQLTGVQFEVGDTATPFEHRPYAEELQLCKRYWREIYISHGCLPWAGVNASWSGNDGGVATQLDPPMRAAPTLTQVVTPTYSSTIGSLPNGVAGSSSSANINHNTHPDRVYIRNNASGSVVFAVSTQSYLDAEL